MAKNDYKNVEKVRELLGDGQLGGLRKRLSSTEKSLNDILKKLSALETQKAEREAAEYAAAEAAEAARVAAEEAAVPVCGDCGAVLAEGQRFCGSCGKAVE